MPSKKKKLSRLLFLVSGTVLLLFWATFAHAAEIMTADGQKFQGKILEEQADYVLMEIENGVQVRIEKAEIVYIQREDIKEGTLKEYPIWGLTYGSPTVLNLVAGYYFRDFGAKVSGAYWGGVRGIQGNLSLKLVDDESFLANFSLVGGTIGTNSANNGYSLWSSGYWSGTNWIYGGIGFDINYNGFVFELDGVTGNFPNPIALPIQIGFAERFN